jgi:UDP-N-acetylglucosamine enolpyruvyl transferase
MDDAKFPIGDRIISSSKIITERRSSGLYNANSEILQSGKDSTKRRLSHFEIPKNKLELFSLQSGQIKEEEIEDEIEQASSQISKKEIENRVVNPVAPDFSPSELTLPVRNQGTQMIVVRFFWNRLLFMFEMKTWLRICFP